MTKDSVDKQNKSTTIVASILGVVIVILIAIIIFGYTKYKNVQTELAETRKVVADSTVDFKSQIDHLQELVDDIADSKNELEDELEDEKDKVNEFEDQIRDITGTVSDLEKLSKIDRELLQKYSKVYFLNEHYKPEKFHTISTRYLVNNNDFEQLHDDVWPFLKNLLDDADDDELELKIVSAFRSFDTQGSLKSQYVNSYGNVVANTFSADQGFSEHQLGTTIDFTTPQIGTSFSGFQNTDEYEWLSDNAYKYGFILSYPEENQYYQFEPWHWRFVGKDLARYLKRKNKDFYDMDQRKIDEYLLELFD